MQESVWVRLHKVGLCAWVCHLCVCVCVCVCVSHLLYIRSLSLGGGFIGGGCGVVLVEVAVVFRF